MVIQVNDLNFSQVFVDTFREWDKLEKKIGGLEPFPIDYDLAPQKESSLGFKDRREVLAQLNDLRRYAQKRMRVTSKADKRYYELLEYSIATLTASITYLSALMFGHFVYQSYYRLINGIWPAKFVYANNEQAIGERRQRAYSILAKLGYPPNVVGANKYFAENTLLPEEVKDGFHDAIKRYGKAVAQYVGVNANYKNVKFNVIDDPKATFRNYIGAVGDEIKFVINASSVHKWRKGHPEVMTFHEFFGHCLQIFNWRKSIVDGRLDQIYWITCIFQPSYFVQEGLATTLLFYLSHIKLPPYIQFLAEVRYNRTIWNSKQYLICFAGNLSTKRAAMLINDFNPNETTTNFENELKRIERVKAHPLYSAYSTTSEAPAGWYFREKLLPQLKTSNSRQKFLHALYEKPMTFKQALRRL